jgi:hypothetical protein
MIELEKPKQQTIVGPSENIDNSGFEFVNRM